MESTTTRPPAATAIEGVHYLLARESGRPDWVARYEPAELVEMFSVEQRLMLLAGEPVIIGRLRWSDMVATTRLAA